MPLEAAAVGAFAGDDVMRPPTSTIFQQARRWYRLHAFIRNVIHLKLGFFNSGLLGERLVAANPKQPDGEKKLEVHPGIRAVNAGDTEKVDQWKQKNAEEIARVTLDIWMSFLMLRNVVCLWRKPKLGVPSGRVIIKPPESVGYSDEFGVELLTLKHGLTGEQIDGLPGLSAAERALLKTTQNLKLTHDSKVFFFKVLKEEPVGMGFGWPDMATLFHACSLNESLLVGDRHWPTLPFGVRAAFARARNQVGQSRGQSGALHEEAAGRSGEERDPVEEGSHSDGDELRPPHQDWAGRPEPMQFDTKRYAQVAEQMAVWGLPFAQMLNGQINPYLMTLARQLGDTDRKRVRPYLTAVLQEALLAPAPITLQWDDACFWDSRMLLDLLKAGVASRAGESGKFPAANAGQSGDGTRGEGSRCGVAGQAAAAGV